MKSFFWTKTNIGKRYLLFITSTPGRHFYAAKVKETDMLSISPEIQNHATKVLIVDDEPNMAKAIQRILKRAGFNTRIARSGMEAGIWLHYFTPDIMTLDIKMPDINGQQILGYVSDLTQANSLKVLVVTGTSEQEINSMDLTGATDILHKPFNNQALLEKVNNISQYSTTTG